VNVILKGTSIGTITDFDGNYSINVSSSDAILVFSSIGFVSKEIVSGSKTTINVSLESDLMALDEVIVVGFGTQKKTTLTGAVSQVKGDDMLRAKGTSNAAIALQGEVPGVVITRTSPRPGNENFDIKIRGDISVNGIDPLILLDGLEIPMWQLGTINSNDIETYSIIKDGSAAIFGTKAAGGVILITTKKGKKGKMEITYKGEIQVNMPNDMPIANLSEWAQLWLVAGDNDEHNYLDSDGNEQYAAPNYRFFSRDELVSIIDGTMPMAPESYYWFGKDQYFSDVSQFDAIYGNTISERHDISVSGGSDKATYRTSFGYADERSPIAYVYDGARRYNFRTNLSYEINDYLSMDVTTSYDNRTVSSPIQGVGSGLQNMNLFPLYNPDGQYYDNFGASNPLALLDEGGRDDNNTEIFRLGGKITLDLDKHIKGLSFSYLGNMSARDARRTYRYTSVTMYDWFGNVTFTPTTLLSSSLRVDVDKHFFQNHVFQANYNKSIGDHNFALMANVTSELNQVSNYQMNRSNMLSDDLDDLNTGDATTQTNSGGSNAVGLVAYLGKFNYDYKSIYLLELLGRRDGSSRFNEENRWKNFFSVSGGVNLHQLSFVQDLNVFDNLKIRASYGETGSISGIGNYDYISLINTGSTIFGSDPSLANTAIVSSLISEDRSWERVANTNIAVDFSLLDRRLNGVIEVYHRENNDMLIDITYPAQIGFNSGAIPKTNSGDFTNNGYELSLNWKDKIGEVKYNVGLSFWDSDSEVKRYEGKTAITIGSNSSIEGKPLNALYAYKTDGVLSTEAEVLDYYNQYGFVDQANQNTMKTGTLLPGYRTTNRLLPGNVRRVDVNGDGIIDQDDLVFVGDANPHLSYAIRFGAEYKGLDFSAFFQGVGEQNILREGALAYPFRSWWTNQNTAFLGTTWTVDNPNAENPAAFYNTSRKTWNYGDTNDINIIKASYLRCKTISLGYTIPQNTVEKAGLNRVRLSLSGNDLFVFTNINDGLDPEHNNESGSSTMPFVSSIILGVEVSF
ncbi:SusC/RagA family TonB-linked outer membrane protein, partial [Flavicella sp.]|uniref:SusC/RagA family TonB-linked outer membrane protein n=1 Tax=Flavicella sp. TaxID=2957742 RepID=UPI0030183621